MPQYSRRRLRRRGHSLLELIAATTIITLAVVPALRLVRDAMEQSRAIETRELATTLCVSTMEQRLAETSHAWDEGAFSGDFAAIGYGSLRYYVACSDAPADGGIDDRLMAIAATVWEDADGDAALDAGEIAVSMASKAAKLESYPN